MYQKNNANRLPRLKKSAVFAIAAALVLLCAIGTTLALLIDKTDVVENKFEYATVPPEIDEKTDNGVKKNVKIENTGNVPAYIRVKVIVTWQDEDGNVAATLPEPGTDYVMDVDDNVNWFKKDDGYYYHRAPVAAGKETSVLIERCSKTSTANIPDGYDLSVEILAQSIQSEPKDAVKSAWGVTVTDGNLTEN